MCTSVLFWRISEKSAALFLESKMKEGRVDDNGDSESAAIDWVEVMGFEQEYVTSLKPLKCSSVDYSMFGNASTS